MTPPSGPLATTINADLTEDFPVQLGQAGKREFPPFATFGLHHFWEPAYEWAVRNRVLPEVLLFVDTCLTHDNTNVFGTLLEEITSDLALERLSAWGETDLAAARLNRLGLAVRLHPEILSTYHPRSKTISARAHLKRNFERDYLMALALEWLNFVPEDQQDWMQVMRVWTLVQALERASRGIIQDHNLRKLATGLRLACEHDTRRQMAIAPLRTDIENFDDLNRHLADQATAAAKRTSRQETTLRTLLKALAAVATGADAADDEHRAGAPVRLVAAHLLCGTHSISGAQQLRTVNYVDDEESPPATAIVGDDEAPGAVLVDIDPAQSYAHQSLQAGSVLLLGIEDYQYLPWSWPKPNPPEAQKLDEWVKRLRRSPIEIERMLGALNWLAITTGRSLRRVLDFKIETQPTGEWSLDPSKMVLHRLPPHRSLGWLPDGENERNWVRPVADFISIAIPTDIAATFAAMLGQETAALHLGDLWFWPDNPLATWRAARPQELSRLTPGMLAQMLPQRLLELSADAVLARLLASHPDSAMPGACAYASWTQAQVESLLSQETPPPSAPAARNTIGGGSRLDPIENLLISALAKAAGRLDELRESGDPVLFHNAYTAYSVVLLLAATGARPVQDPFESPAHFDLAAGFCFVDDKGSDEAHAGRLIPLPRTAVEFLRNDYPRHLRQAALIVEPKHPMLAERIRRLAAGRGDADMPYFFILDGLADSGWTSVSETVIELSGIFGWPLPLRLFRHRLSIRLRRINADAELIDAALGHAEAGSATHGDDSFRTWSHDMLTLRPYLETAFNSLQPRWPATWFSPPDLRQGTFRSRARTLPQNAPGPLFGIARRAHQRTEHRLEVDRGARREIEEFLAGRSLRDLLEDDINELTKRLIFNDKGLPRTTAHLRYNLFMDQLEGIWREEGRRVRIRKRFAVPRPPPSPFSPLACGAIDLHIALTAALRSVHNDIPASRLQLKDAAGLAVVGLCLLCRVTDLSVLTDLAARRNVRLVTLKGRAYVEHGQNLKSDDPDACVRRFCIDPHLCRIIDCHLGHSREKDLWENRTPEIFTPLAALLSDAGHPIPHEPTLSSMTEALCRIVDQVNVMTIPGVAAGYLAGRVESYALGWRDWSRMVLGEILLFPEPPREDDAEDLTELPYGGVAQEAAQDRDGEESLSVAMEMIAAIRTLLEEHGSDPAAADSRDKRRAMANALGQQIAIFNGRVSTAVLMLGQWLPAILYRPGKRGTYIAVSTLQRYLSALAPRFVDFGHDLDLLSADEHEVTEFYSDILTSLEVEDSAMVAGRLGDFHSWASRQGVADPDWSQMPDVMPGRRAAPGFISEQEYHSALKLLLSDLSVEHEERLARASLLIYCYRHALREKEALGLLREDLQHHGEDMEVVLVRDNHLRKLKTPRSRRQVPLLFRLAPIEIDTLRDAGLLLESEVGDRARTGLLAQTIQDRSLLQRTVRAVIRVLKHVTGNPRAVLHHARHTAPNRVGAEIVGLAYPPLSKAMRRGARSANRNDIAKVLLGTARPTRRTSWALARYTGHAGSKTLFKSYFHLFDLWLDELLPIQQEVIDLNMKSVFVLDSLPRMKPVDISLLDELRHPQVKLTVVRALKFLRLLARKRTVVDAASATGLTAAVADAIAREVGAVGTKMRLSSTTRKGGKDTIDEFSFLRRVNEAAWTRLLKLAAKLDDAAEKTDTKAMNRRAFPIVMAEVGRLIGPTRQLVMWDSGHFAVVRMFIDGLHLTPDRYALGLSGHCTTDDRTARLAKEFGFIATANDFAAAIAVGNQRQLDSTFDWRNDNRVEKRCCLLLKESHDFELRNRFDLVALFLAFCFSTIDPVDTSIPHRRDAPG